MHTVSNKEKLQNRVRRLLGQMDAARRAIEADAECTEVMQLLAAARGATNSLLAEVVKDHIRHHMIDRKRRRSPAEVRAARDLIDVVQSYVR
jgi:DNA-binding FrmR family transcriptional regulator